MNYYQFRDCDFNKHFHPNQMIDQLSLNDSAQARAEVTLELRM